MRTHRALTVFPGSGSVSGTNSVMCVMGSVVHLKALVNTGSQELAAAGGPGATHLLDPLPPKWVITVAICKGHGPLSASNDASLRESAAKQQGTWGAVPYPSTGRTEYRCREKKKQQQQSNVAPRAKLLPLSLATLQPAARLLLPSTPRDYSALPAQTRRTHFFWCISPVNSENIALRWYHPLSAPPSPLMIQCINTFSHQRGADVLRYRSGSQRGSWAATEDSGCENASGGTLWIPATHLATFLSRAENQTIITEMSFRDDTLMVSNFISAPEYLTHVTTPSFVAKSVELL
ncbi:unnamed protein product [Leuciscus chuanchicus]